MPLSFIIKTLTCVSYEFDFKIVSIFLNKKALQGAKTPQSALI